MYHRQFQCLFFFWEQIKMKGAADMILFAAVDELLSHYS